MGGIKMTQLEKPKNTNQIQTGILVVLRITIGWHFLYEGLNKVLNPGWSSHDYLASASWLFSGLFHWMADTPAVLMVVDFLNVWGQIFIGLGLMLGALTQTACIAGMVLLALYYFANPPAYSIVNTNLVEFIVLGLLAAVPTGRIIGIDRFLARRRFIDSVVQEPQQAVDLTVEDRKPGSPLIDRRNMIKGLAGIPFVAALGSLTAAKEIWLSNEEKDLVDVVAKVHEDGGKTSSTGWGYKFSKDEGERPLLRTHTTVNTIDNASATGKAAHSPTKSNRRGRIKRAGTRKINWREAAITRDGSPLPMP